MPDGDVRAEFGPDRRTYIRDHVLMATIGAIGATGALYFVGNADYWVGAVAAFLALGVRGWYLASEELTLNWTLTTEAVVASNGKRVDLRDIQKVRRVGSAVQLITHRGDKHLMKYLSTPTAAATQIAKAAGVYTG